MTLNRNRKRKRILPSRLSTNVFNYIRADQEAPRICAGMRSVWLSRALSIDSLLNLRWVLEWLWAHFESVRVRRVSLRREQWCDPHPMATSSRCHYRRCLPPIPFSWDMVRLTLTSRHLGSYVSYLTDKPQLFISRCSPCSRHLRHGF
jgi:hypothetical protein